MLNIQKIKQNTVKKFFNFIFGRVHDPEFEDEQFL